MELICLNIISQFNREAWGVGKGPRRTKHRDGPEDQRGTSLEKSSNSAAQTHATPCLPQNPTWKRPEWAQAMTQREAVQARPQMCPSSA